MATNSVENILKGAKDTLAKANKFTQSVEGNPTSSFAKKDTPSHISKVPVTHEYSHAPYGLVQEAASAGQGIKAKMENEAAAKKSIE